MRSWGTALVVAAAALIGWPGEASAAGKDVTLTLVRTTDGPASFQLTTWVTPGDQNGFTGFVGARIARGGVAEVFPGSQVTHGRTDDPTVFGNGSTVTACSLGAPCHIGEAFLGLLYIFWEDDGGPDAMNRVYVVLEGEDTGYKLEGSGWKVVEADYDYRYVDGQDADAVGASHTTHGATLLTGATAKGGPRGSIAQAVPPCSQTVVSGVSRGVGELTLDGGVATPAPTLRCPTSTVPLVDHASGATTWDAHGQVVGQSDLSHTHLFVVDLPKEEDEQGEDGVAPAPTGGAVASPAASGGSRSGSGSSAAPSTRDGASAPSRSAFAAAASPCRPSIHARRTRRAVTVRALSARLCRVSYKLVAKRRVLARGAAVARPGRTRTTTLRLRSRTAGPFRLVVDVTDAAGSRAPSRTLTVR